MTYAIYDIESTYLTSFGSYHVSDIFCIGVQTYDDQTKKLTPTKIYTQQAVLGADGDFKDALEIINSCDYHVMHNGTRFDDIAMEAFGTTITSKPFDTILSDPVLYTKDELISMH